MVRDARYSDAVKGSKRVVEGNVIPEIELAPEGLMETDDYSLGCAIIGCHLELSA